MITIQHTPAVDGNKFILAMEITASSDLPLELFLHRYNIDNSDLMYSAICTIDNINNVGVDLIPGSPFVRKKDATLEFDSTLELSEFFERVKGELTQLDIDYQKVLEEDGYGETTVTILNEEI